MNLVGLLVAILVLAILVYAVKILIDWLEFPAPIRTVILLIVGVIVLLILLNLLGVGVGGSISPHWKWSNP
jgi:multisubunit Na+/H+ antiporter MnhB subunit